MQRLTQFYNANRNRYFDSIKNILLHELSHNINEVNARRNSPNWTVDECSALTNLLNWECQQIKQKDFGGNPKDSIKGESVMRFVFSEYTGKAADMMTFCSSFLIMSELKCAIKIGGPGPFRNLDSFEANVASKFEETACMLATADEVIRPPWLIVVCSELFPTLIQRIKELEIKVSTLASPSRRSFCLCTINGLAKIIYNDETAINYIDKYDFEL